MYNFHKNECLQRAMILVEKADDASLRYACLELRQCIESIAYDKLKMYKKFVPESEFSRWQPKRVFDFLEEIEPKSVKDYTFHIFEQKSDSSLGETVFSGNHRTLTSKHIKKTYNKLGSYLHTPTLLQQTDLNKKSARLASDLSEIIEDLTPIVESSFDTNIGQIVNFKCESCGDAIYHRTHNLEVGKHVRCLSSVCGMLYVVTEVQGTQIRFEPVQVKIPCDCGHTTFINYLKMKDPSHVNCLCGKIYDIKQQWVYGERT
ncbi:conserved hypothetical protein [Vibrio crassostreae]|uniref:hypothetical protein n=2 Tax=Vibrio crassostreae TaxID=246167 RepID=UPI00104A873D|nr:hypothetical protein [Vibrio crassostreae]TCT74070.1 hypothetical protein EDB46_107138 [Vibrio crassostreae]CAK1862033.1 conserved hypothetical protein [Vibrio crassostreae]CAK2069475.1 conserved hypothetical protein [Vibrio crassostreae]CAK2076509.1 conserved hypothetical protein [Vibrio crassostreae]CAK2110923.1 conserved hypothetical protein [Vibrio crassostreae]